MLESTEKGEVRKTVGNYRLILMNDPNLQGAFRLNMFTDKIDITRDLGWYRESDSLTDVDLKFLVVYLEKHYGLSNEKRIEDVIKVVANENRYHPVLDRINSITWSELSETWAGAYEPRPPGSYGWRQMYIAGAWSKTVLFR